MKINGKKMVYFIKDLKFMQLGSIAFIMKKPAPIEIISAAASTNISAKPERKELVDLYCARIACWKLVSDILFII